MAQKEGSAAAANGTRSNDDAHIKHRSAPPAGQRDRGAPVDTALRVARLGWAVLPITSNAKNPPLVSQWPSLATTDESKIRDWWSNSPEANPGVHLGRSGLVVIDEDCESAVAEVEVLEAEFGELPPTLTIRTNRGRHRVYRDPGGLRSRLKARPGVDLLAGDRYILAPGSVVGGVAREIEPAGRGLDEKPAELPEAWVGFWREGAQAPDRPAVTGKAGTTGNQGTGRESKGEHSPVSPSPCDMYLDGIHLQAPIDAAGQRHDALFRLARLVKGCGRRITDAERRALFSRWWAAYGHYCTTPRSLAEAEFDHMVESVRTPCGWNPLDEAIAAADRNPTPPPGCEDRTERARRLAVVAFHKSRIVAERSGASDMTFSASEAAKAIWGDEFHEASPESKEICRRVAHRELKQLSDPGGPLELVRRGKPGHPGSNASRYRWIGIRNDESGQPVAPRC